jgi:hypothetical protein
VRGPPSYDKPIRGGDRTGRTYRGSRKRLSRVAWRENTPPSVWILLLISLVMMLGALAWVSQEERTHDHHRAVPRGSAAPGNHRMADRSPADADLQLQQRVAEHARLNAAHLKLLPV